LNLGLEQYVAMGDGLSNDLFPSIDSPPSDGAATLFARDLARRYGCSRHKNLSEIDATLGSIYRKQMPHLPESKGDLVVTLTGGLVDLILLSAENSRTQIIRPVDELVAGYGGMVKVIRRKAPGALIVVSTVPDPHGDWTHPNHALVVGTLRFNERLKETLDGRTNVVVADLFGELAGPRFFLDRSPTNPNAVGALAIRSAWHGALESANYIEAVEVA